MLFDNNVVLPNSKIFSAFISILFAICLVIYMKKSKLGRAIRATAQNARAAKILGVDTEKVYAATFGINAALCGVAGALISITFHNSSLHGITIYNSIIYDRYCCRLRKFTRSCNVWYGSWCI